MNGFNTDLHLGAGRSYAPATPAPDMAVSIPESMIDASQLMHVCLLLLLDLPL